MKSLLRWEGYRKQAFFLVYVFFSVSFLFICIFLLFIDFFLLYFPYFHWLFVSFFLGGEWLFNSNFIILSLFISLICILFSVFSVSLFISFIGYSRVTLC